MTAKQIEKRVSEIKQYTKKVIASTHSAKKFLISTGVYTQKGGLNKAYK